jgi:hypothetical protein
MFRFLLMTCPGELISRGRREPRLTVVAAGFFFSGVLVGRTQFKQKSPFGNSPKGLA